MTVRPMSYRANRNGESLKAILTASQRSRMSIISDGSVTALSVFLICIVMSMEISSNVNYDIESQ